MIPKVQLYIKECHNARQSAERMGEILVQNCGGGIVFPKDAMYDFRLGELSSWPRESTGGLGLGERLLREREKERERQFHLSMRSKLPR